MIKIIENESQILDFCVSDLYAIRIKSLLLAYGTKYDFATFYAQFNEDNEQTAIISKLDNDFTVCVCDGFDANELWEFFCTIGYSSVLCDECCDFNAKYDTGIVMVTAQKNEYIIPYTEIDEYPKLMDLFSLDDYDTTDFEAWYVDLNHRIRHNCARAYSLNVNDEIISSAIFSAIYNYDAIITAVKTQPEFRRMGYASALVSYMIGDIKGSTYLMREMGKNEEFYKNLGFINIGKWRLYK